MLTTIDRLRAAACCTPRLSYWLIALLASVVLALAPGGALAQERDPGEPAQAEFAEALDPHGQWVEHPRYGETWVPYANQEPGWRPYSRGQWVFTEEHGWYWDSEEEFGWVVYHYGRWTLDRRWGWMWVPGDEWGPAWVAWREGEEAIGWLPLPPEADLDMGPDGVYTFDTLDHPRYASAWIFVAPALMTAPLVWRHFYPPNRTTYFFGRSRFSTHYAFRDRRVFNRGIDRRFIEGRMGRPVPVLQVRPLANPRDFRRERGGGERRSVGIYRPQMAPPQFNRDRFRQPGSFGPGARSWPGPSQGGRDGRSPDVGGRPRFDRGPQVPSPNAARPQPGGAPEQGRLERRREWQRDGAPGGAPSGAPSNRVPERQPPPAANREAPAFPGGRTGAGGAPPPAFDRGRSPEAGGRDRSAFPGGRPDGGPPRGFDRGRAGGAPEGQPPAQRMAPPAPAQQPRMAAPPPPPRMAAPPSPPPQRVAPPPQQPPRGGPPQKAPPQKVPPQKGPEQR